MIQILKSKSTLVQAFLFLFLAVVFIYINIPFIMPFILAGIFSLGLEDFISKISDKLRIKKTFCVIFFLMIALALFWIPLSFAVNRAVLLISQPQTVETDKFLVQIKNLRKVIHSSLQKISDQFGIDLLTPVKTTLDNFAVRIGEILIKISADFFTQLPTITVTTLIFVVFIFLMLLRSRQIKNFVIRYSILNVKLTETLIQEAKSSCSITLSSTFVIGIIQALVIGVGSLIFEVGDFWFIVVVTFFVSFIPVIGAAPVGYLLAILAFIGDRVGAGIGLAVTATIAGTIDNILRPYLVVSEKRVSAVIAFTCVVGALLMLGFPGLLIGPAVLNLVAGIGPVLLKWEKSD